MEIKTNKKSNTVIVVNDNGEEQEIKIKNLNGWNRHSFPRMCLIDANTGKVLAGLSSGGSYGWIVNCRDLRRRSLLLKACKKAQKDKLGWPWNNIQC